MQLLHLPHGHSADALREAMATMVGAVPDAARLTLTWDQGSELAQHDLLAAFFADGICFAHPAGPCMRGSNENTNGLLRQYFPKGSDLRAHTAAALRAVEDLLNHRPRKVLGWRTPAQVLNTEIRSS